MPEGTLHQLVRLRSWDELDRHLQHNTQHKDDCSCASCMNAQYFVNNRSETVLHLASAFGTCLVDWGTVVRPFFEIWKWLYSILTTSSIHE